MLSCFQRLRLLKNQVGRGKGVLDKRVIINVQANKMTLYIHKFRFFIFTQRKPFSYLTVHFGQK